MTKKDKSLEVLQNPVHAVILKPHHLQDLQRRGLLPGGGVVKQAPEQKTLPKKKKPEKHTPIAKFNNKLVVNTAREVVQRTRLSVLHNRIPAVPKDLTPPCGECTSSMCCRAFVVRITKQEYESGYYTPYAIELDPKYTKQLRSKFLMPVTATSPVHSVDSSFDYYLEGRLGEACPFLKNNRCSIYGRRPITCRTYTCVNDKRITQEMRSRKYDD